MIGGKHCEPAIGACFSPDAGADFSARPVRPHRAGVYLGRLPSDLPRRKWFPLCGPISASLRLSGLLGRPSGLAFWTRSDGFRHPVEIGLRRRHATHIGGCTRSAANFRIHLGGILVWSLSATISRSWGMSASPGLLPSSICSCNAALSARYITHQRLCKSYSEGAGSRRSFHTTSAMNA